MSVSIDIERLALNTLESFDGNIDDEEGWENPRGANREATKMLLSSLGKWTGLFCPRHDDRSFILKFVLNGSAWLDPLCKWRERYRSWSFRLSSKMIVLWFKIPRITLTRHPSDFPTLLPFQQSINILARNWKQFERFYHFDVQILVFEAGVNLKYQYLKEILKDKRMVGVFHFYFTLFKGEGQNGAHKRGSRFNN